MPTFNSNDYLSLPQQVSKNKKDIASLDSRVTNVEADVAENMSVPIIGSCQVLAFDSYISLDIPSQSALGQLVIANHANYQRERLFGLTIQMSPSLVDDASQFPLANGDVMYNGVFVMGARQLVNIATDEYHYVAISTSIDKRFQIEWNFKHSDNTFTTAPDLIVKNLKPEQDNTLTMSFSSFPSNPCFEWDISHGPLISYSFEFIDSASNLTMFKGEITTTDVYSSPMESYGYVIAKGTNKVLINTGKVKVTATKCQTPLVVNCNSWAGRPFIVKIRASDNRPLAQTTISDYYMYGSSTARCLNYGSADEILLNGEPAVTSNVADKRKVLLYLDSEAQSTNPPTVNIDGVVPRPSNPYKITTTKMSYPGGLLSNAGWPRLYRLDYMQGGLENQCVISAGSVITMTFITASELTASFGSTIGYPVMFNMIIRTASPATYYFGTAKIEASSLTATITVLTLSGTATAPVGGFLSMFLTFAGY